MKTLAAIASVLALTIGSADAAPSLRTTPVFVTMMVGDPEQVIGTNGPLEAIVRCLMSDASTRIQVLWRSSVDNWSATARGSGLAAGEVVFFESSIQVGSTIEVSGTPGFSALAPNGLVLSVPANTLTIALNLYDHDCIATGMVATIRGKEDF